MPAPAVVLSGVARRRLNCRCGALLATTALVAATAFAPAPARAQDATWLLNPTSGDYNTATNWNPATVPTGTAFFGASNTTALTVSASTVGGWTFNGGASAYTFANNGFISFIGAGIAINGGSAAIVNDNSLSFNVNSAAGSATITNNDDLNFNDASTAGNSTITNTDFASIDFVHNSTAGNATIINNGNIFFATTSAAGAATITNNHQIFFSENSTAGNSAITNNSSIFLEGSSTAGSAAITNNGGGLAQFADTSSAGSAHISNSGELDFLNFSNAGNAIINNNVGGLVGFFGNATAGNATIINNSDLTFSTFSTAGSATITNGVSSDLRFDNFSTAGSATITNSGNISFLQDSTADGAAISNNSGAVVDFSGSDGPARDDRLTAGSIAGGGLFELGVNELTVGGDNLSTEVSGVILGTGSLVKVGAGTLTLSGNATLSGTTVDGGTLAVNGGTLNASNTIIVGSSAGSSGMLSFGAGGAATTLNLAVGLSGTGTLVVQNGGTLTDFGGLVGDLTGSQGMATVSGAGSTWTSTNTFQVGAGGTGALTVEAGGTVNSGGGGSVGLSAGSTGSVTVTGPGSAWNNGPGGGLNIGSFGAGALTISNGGIVSNNTAFTANIGEGAGSQGAVTVTGAGSTWSNSSGVNIGDFGTGALTIADGGVVNGPIVIATNAGAIGTLNIGAGAGDPAAAPGTLTAASVAFGSGAGAINFNHTSASYVFAPAISGAGAVNVFAGVTILTAANTYTGGTTISAGVLQLGNGGTTGGIVGDVTDNGTLAFSRSDTVTFPGVISGSGSLAHFGPGVTILTAANTYTGGTTISAGTLQLGAGGAGGGIVGDVTDDGALAFNRNDAVTFAGVISGSGSVSQVGSGTTVLTGNNSYGGATTVSAGALFIDGDQSAATGATNVAAGATLGGVGVIGGNVSVANGGALAPGGQGGGIGTLTINGSLGLNSGSILNYIFGQAGAVGGPFNDLTVVKGDLTLAGTLNVALTPGDVFEPGVYRVISYAGALTDNGLLLGGVPPGTTEVVQTSVAHQVNLVNTTGVTLDYWDGGTAANKNNGLVDGGDGVWQGPAGNSNWTNVTGAGNGPWANGVFAIFEAAPGTVTVDDSLGQVVASGMQFAVGGYTVTGGPIALVETEAGSGATVVRVGDGTAAGAGMTATIASVLQGSTQLVKDDLGVLVLTGANTYAGGTAINAGTLQLGDGGTTGSILGDVVDNGTLAFNRSDIVSFAGVISGGGSVIQAGTGATILTGTNTYTGGTTISAGTLQLGAGGAAGSIVGDVVDDGTLAFNRSDVVIFAGVISGGGSVIQAGTGATVLTGTNTYSGGTTISAGTLQLGDGGTAGSIIGDVTNSGVLAFDRSDTVAFAGEISGSGAVHQVGSGTTILTGTNTYTGGTTISAGTLQLGDGGTTGSIAGDVANGGMLAFDRSDTVTFAGVISGAGAVTQIGSGTAVLTGANTYTGGTTISAGTLQLGNGGTTGSIVGDVVDSGTLAFNRSDVVTFAGVISGGGVVAQIGSGVTILTADSPFTGGAAVNAGTLMVGDFGHPSAALSGGGQVAVAHGGTLGGYGSVSGAVVNDGVITAGSATPGSSASPTGAFTIVGSLLNRGAVRLGSGASIGNVLEVRGAYGGAGGTMAINTVLGGDGSPSDRLVINGGAATGATMVQVTNVGGPGVETTGDGILVVSAINGATTAPGAFVLASRELRAGAFDYDLFHGGVSGDAPNNWFLRSDFIVPPVEPVPPIPPVVRPPEPIPPDPPPEPLPPGVYPIIGPELATYGVVQPLARQLGQTILGTLDDRIGDTYGPDCGGVVRPTSSFCRPSVWGRVIGASIDNRYRAFADPRANGDQAGLQFGVDILRGSLIAGHSDRAGLYGAYGETDVDVDGLVTNPAATAYVLAHTGSAHLDALSGGAYWTHVGPGGWYLDAVLQGTSYSGSASTAFARLSTDGWGFLASLEGGSPFAVPQLGPGFVIEPQAQILWQEVSFGRRNDGLGDVGLGDTTGATGRIGLRGRWTITTAGGQVWQPYVRANLWQDWGAHANTMFGADSVGLSTRATLLQLGGGLTAKLVANLSLFASTDYEFAVGDTNGDRRDSVRGDLGLRYTW